MTAHPARLVLADHQPIYVAPSTGATGPIRCCCRRWTGPWCDFPEHQMAVLEAAGLLTAGTPPARILAERGEQSLASRHVKHYRSCGCLGDSAVCCDPTCACEEAAT